ncbi:hypothetical protein AAY473_021681 [Plecturocebus cupreus]
MVTEVPCSLKVQAPAQLHTCLGPLLGRLRQENCLNHDPGDGVAVSQEMRFCCVAQVGLKFPASSDPLASTSQSVEITERARTLKTQATFTWAAKLLCASVPVPLPFICWMCPFPLLCRYRTVIQTSAQVAIISAIDLAGAPRYDLGFMLFEKRKFQWWPQCLELCRIRYIGIQDVIIDGMSNQHFGRLRQVDHLRSGVRDQPDPHGETPSLQVQKLARCGYILSLAFVRCCLSGNSTFGVSFYKVETKSLSPCTLFPGTCTPTSSRRAHLMLFPHGPQRLHLVLGVSALLQAQIAHRGSTAHAVHAVVLHFMLRARGELAGRAAPRRPGPSASRALAAPASAGGALGGAGGCGGCLGGRGRRRRRLHQAMLSEGSPGWMALELAGRAVEDVALLAERGCWLWRGAVAQLADGHRHGCRRPRHRPAALLVPLHYGLQQPVALEAAQAAMVQGGAAVALRARDGARRRGQRGAGGTAGRSGRGAGWCGHHGQHTNPVGGLEARGVGSVAAVCLAVQAQLVRVVPATSRTAAEAASCTPARTAAGQARRRVVLQRGSGSCARGQPRAPGKQERLGQVLLAVRGLHRDCASAREADIVGTGQDDGLPKQRAAHGTLQLFLHRGACCPRCSALGMNGRSSGDPRRISVASSSETAGGGITRACPLHSRGAHPSLCPVATALG